MAETLLEITREEGVADLPRLVKVTFARALKAEREGKPEEAEKYLQAACDEELKTKQS